MSPKNAYIYSHYHARKGRFLIPLPQVYTDFGDGNREKNLKSALVDPISMIPSVVQLSEPSLVESSMDAHNLQDLKMQNRRKIKPKSATYGR